MKKRFLILVLLLGIINLYAVSKETSNNDNLLKVETQVNCKWFLDGKEIPEVTSNFIEAKKTGVYKVEYSDESGNKVVQEFAVVVYNGKIITIRLIGDSTVCDYDASRAPLTGWGQVFNQIMLSDSVQKIKYAMNADSVKIVNYARGGRSTRTFYQEGLWDEVYNALQEGDYLLIQFGHNDASTSHPDRYVDTAGYKFYLRYFITQTRNKGGVPVLVTPVNRNYPWSGGVLSSVHGNYPYAMKEVAEELHVPLIDLTARSCEHFTSVGKDYCSNKYFMNLEAGEFPNYPDGNSDNTHFQVEGAVAVANLVYQGLLDLRDVVVDTVSEEVGLVTGARWYETKYDSVAELIARPKFGYKFTGWSGDVESLENPLKVKIDTGIHLVAQFEEATKPQYYVYSGKATHGDISITPFGDLYEEGDTLTILAMPDEDMEFYSWFGEVVDTTNPLKLIVTKDATLNALFKEKGETIIDVNAASESSCSFDSSLLGYTMESYAIAEDPVSDSISWTIYPSETKKYSFRFRYKSSNTEKVYADVYINGELIRSNYYFTPLSDSSWNYSINQYLDLVPQKVEIKMVIKGADYPLYIDHIKFNGEVSNAGSTAADEINTINKNIITSFPNPINSNATLSLDVKAGGAFKIDLLDIRGVVVDNIFSGTFNSNHNSILYHMNNITAGNYIIRCQNNNNVSYSRLIVQ